MPHSAFAVQHATRGKSGMFGSALQPFGVAGGRSTQPPPGMGDVCPHWDSKALLQHGIAVEPSGTTQFVLPQGTLPAGGGGPASTFGVDVEPPVPSSVLEPPVPLSLPVSEPVFESLPHAIGERPASTSATPRPRLTIAMFIALLTF